MLDPVVNGLLLLAELCIHLIEKVVSLLLERGWVPEEIGQLLTLWLLRSHLEGRLRLCWRRLLRSLLGRGELLVDVGHSNVDAGDVRSDRTG